MAIPRHVGEVSKKNTSPTKKNEEVFNPFLNDDEDEGFSARPNLDTLTITDEDEAFEDDRLPPAAEVIPKSAIKNLDDEDLDALLGINETLNDTTPSEPIREPEIEHTPTDDYDLPDVPQKAYEEHTEHIEEDSTDLSDLDELISSLNEENDHSDIEELIKNPSENIQDEKNEDDISDLIMFDEDDNFKYEEETTNSTDVDFDNIISFEDDADEDNASKEDEEDWGFEEIPKEHLNPFSKNIDENFEEPQWDEDEDQDEDDELPSEATQEPLEQPETEESNTETSEPVKSLRKPSNSLIDKIKKKLDLIKAQVTADAKGESIPKDLNDDIPDYAKPIENNEENDEEEIVPAKPKKARNKKPSKIFKPFKKIYNLITNFFFGIITGSLGILSKLPVIGKLFKPLLSATNILRKIAVSLPIVFIFGGMVLASYLSVPKSSEVELPDEGSATFSSFTYDDGLVSGIIQNTGEVTAEVIANFKIYTIKPGINPISWFMPKEIASCSSDLITIDIDDSKEVSITCEKVKGFIPRVSGELE